MKHIKRFNQINEHFNEFDSSNPLHVDLSNLANEMSKDVEWRKTWMKNIKEHDCVLTQSFTEDLFFDVMGLILKNGYTITKE